MRGYALGVRRAIHLLFCAALFGAPTASAQSGALPAVPQSGAVPGCYVLTIYGLMPTCTLSPGDQDVIASRAAAYLTDGARVTAAPSAGPGAAYFRNASQVLAAPTTSWVQTVSPDLGAGSFGTASPATAPAPRPSAAPTTPVALIHPPPAPTASASASAAAPEASAAPSITAPPALEAPQLIPESPEAIPESPSPTSAPPASPTQAVATSPAEAPAAIPQTFSAKAIPEETSDEPEEPKGTGLAQSMAWGIIGTPIGALLIFVAVRALALRAGRS